MSDNLKKQIATLIEPIWMDPPEGPHLLNNYPGQADKYRASAREKADAILAIPEIAEALKMKPIQTMKVRD